MIQLPILSLITLLLSLLTTGWVKQRFSQNLLDIPIDRLLGSLVVDSSLHPQYPKLAIAIYYR